ncbi:MAG: dUTP diphosphatase [Candidatus Nanoarchaeia archaeon]
MKKKSKKKNIIKISSDIEVLQVKKLSKESFIPEYALLSDIGFDLRANETVSFMPMEQKQVKTGVAIKIPEGNVGLIRDRAGIVNEMGVHTAAGTFDPAYTGEVSVILINLGDTTVEIEKGMRIAQMIILPVKKMQIKEVKELPITPRDKRGFGSTGMKEIVKEINNLDKK